MLVRVERLRPAQAALSLVAAAGGRIDHDVLERVAGDLELPAALRAALDAHILVREHEDRGIAFRHGLPAEVVYSRLLPQERSRMHRAIAAALATAPDASAAATRPSLAPRGAVCRRAACVHRRRPGGVPGVAFAEAGGHLDRAIELWERVAAADGSLLVDRVELLARAAQAARFAGDSRRAIALVKFFDLQALRRARRRRDRDPGRECAERVSAAVYPPV